MGRRQTTRLTGAVVALTVAGAVLFSSAPATALFNPGTGTGYNRELERDTVGGRFQIVPLVDLDYHIAVDYDVMLNGRVLEHTDDQGVSIIGSYSRLNDPWYAKDRFVMVEYHSAGASVCIGRIKVFTIAPTGEVSISETIHRCFSEGVDRIEQFDEESFAFIFDADIYHAPDIAIYDRGAISTPGTVAPIERTFDTAAGKLGSRERSGTLDLSLNGTPLTEIGGLGLHVFGAHPADVPRLAVFGVERGGLSCHYEWRVGEFAEPGGAHFSEPVAECRDRPHIVFPPKGGVLIGFEAWADEPALVFRYKDGSVQQVR